MNKEKWLFLGWSYSRRSEDIASIMEIDYFYYPLKKEIRILQFPFLFFRTFLYLCIKNPHVIFIQNPPVHALASVYLFSLISGKKYVIDSHIIPGTTLIEKPYHRFYLFLHKFYSYSAALTFFHSKAIKERLKKWRCNSIVLENPVRSLEDKTSFTVKKRPAVGVVSSFQPDEKLDVLLEAEKELPDISFYIAGDKSKLDKDVLKGVTPNIMFTDYLKGEYYYEFLKAMDVVVVLTDRQESALLGAYEAVAAETPLVLSDTVTMRYYFPYGAVFVENSKNEMKKGIEKALKKKKILEKEIKELKKTKIENQKKNLSTIENILKM
jgi:glycosyltransferase involved in cell wall biosynthesis